jgi:metallo-beta-lactamase family protein
MPLHLGFHGAASTVTGSCHLLAHDHGRLLVDCGMFQGTKTVRELNYRPFPFQPSGIDQLLLTHAHIDHSGLIPKLVKAGFSGPIIATEPTLDLLRFMLPDSGHIQEIEVSRLNERNRRRGRPTVEPIYTRADAEACLAAARPVDYDRWFEPGAGVRARYWNAGHILGSASIELEVRQQGKAVRLLFSGDIGPDEKAFHADPQGPRDLDYLIVESTYGDRDREDATVEERLRHLQREAGEALRSGGNLIIPAFAVERTQEVLDGLADLMGAGRIPRATIFIDSPLAHAITQVFAKYGDRLDEGAEGSGLFRGAEVRFTRTAEESKALNRIRGGAIIMAASGMCEAGRIRHHLRHNLWRRDATILFVGYQAPGTLGHLLVSGEKRVTIAGEEIAVQARIRYIDSFSGHADRTELVNWVGKRLPVHRAIFLVHGEPPAMQSLREGLAGIGCHPASVLLPALDQGYDLVAEGGPVAHGTAARLPAQDTDAGQDWHNLHARLRLSLGQRLQSEPDDAARVRLLEKLMGEVVG